MFQQIPELLQGCAPDHVSSWFTILDYTWEIIALSLIFYPRQQKFAHQNPYKRTEHGYVEHPYYETEIPSRETSEGPGKLQLIGLTICHKTNCLPAFSIQLVTLFPFLIPIGLNQGYPQRSDRVFHVLVYCFVENGKSHPGANSFCSSLIIS